MKRTFVVIATAAALLFTASEASAQFVAGQTQCPRYGTPQQGQGPKDGTGYGAKNKSGKRTGPQDGSGARNGQRGPQGRGGRR